jgi:hypothetical protein
VVPSLLLLELFRSLYGKAIVDRAELGMGRTVPRQEARDDVTPLHLFGLNNDLSFALFTVVHRTKRDVKFGALLPEGIKLTVAWLDRNLIRP